MVGDSCTVLQYQRSTRRSKVKGRNSCGLLLCSLNALKDVVSDTRQGLSKMAVYGLAQNGAWFGREEHTISWTVSLGCS